MLDIGFGLLITYLYLCNFRNHKGFYYFKDGDIRINKISFLSSLTDCFFIFKEREKIIWKKRENYGTAEKDLFMQL